MAGMDRWPMVGRTEEQAYLAEVIADPDQPGVVVAGRAGVGKTRIVREVVSSLPDHHVELVTATVSASALPFGAFARLLPDDLVSVEQIDLLTVIGRHLARRADGRPIVLVVDDVHLLDALSAAFVHHVATAGLATVLLTLRSGEPAPDAVVTLHRDAIVARLELQPISRTEFNALVEVALGGPIEGLTLERLWLVTEGNALFVRELMSDALDAGTLRSDHGVWRWTGGIGVAPRLRETVAGRLGDLSEAGRRLVELLSVGEPLSVADTDRLAGDASVLELERRGLVTVETDRRRSEVRLAHPLFGETIRAAMPASLRRRLHHDLAENSVLAGVRRNGDALQVAVWREAAGEASDPELLAEAARDANSLSDHRLAERLARASETAGGGFRARLQLGRALLGQDRFDDAEAVLAPLVGEEATDEDREQLADGRVIAVGWGLGRIDDGLEIFEAAERGVTDPAVKALLQAHRATLLSYCARFGEAAELGAAALESVDDDRVRVRSLTSVGISMVMAGRIDDALSLSEKSFEPALRLQDRLPRAPEWVVSMRTSALFLAGRFDEAVDLMNMAIGAIPNLAPQTRARANTYLGRFALAQGRPLTAARLLNDAAATIREYPVGVPATWCLALAAEAHALLGQHDQASAAAAEVAGMARTQVIAFEVDELRALAWVDAQGGRTSAAINQLMTAADLAASRGQRTFELVILHDLLRLGEHRVAKRAQELAQYVDGPWSAAIEAYTNAVLSGAAADLETAAGAFTDIGSSLVAAELWAATSAARQRDGLPARAADAARRSRALAEHCEGARTEPLNRTVAPVALSRREREIATLAADGTTNAQIADNLSISVRTVESHLYAAFAKLGITHRSQLTDTLQQD